jgi:hypothetical protein
LDGISLDLSGPRKSGDDTGQQGEYGGDRGLAAERKRLIERWEREVGASPK